ncbi:MAG: hypothetical protein ACXVCP_16360 [Bdellovibrio sp.]
MVNPIATLPANKEKPISKSHTQLQIVVDKETMALLKEIQSLLSHTIPEGDYKSQTVNKGKAKIELKKKLDSKSQANTDKSRRCIAFKNLKQSEHKFRYK